MHVRLAPSSGFCWGVKRAVDVALAARQKAKGEVLTHGPLIHNKPVVEMLKQKGIGVYDVGTPSNGQTVVVRAHGLPPSTLEHLQKSGYNLVDATCPHVVRTQKRVQQLSAKGYNVLIIGDKNHAEVIGLVGYSHTQVWVVSTPEEAEHLDIPEPIAVVQQSTYSQYDVANILTVLQRRFKDISIQNTLCGVTTKAQSEVTDLLKEVDAMVVVGDRMSANTKKLAKVATEARLPTYLVESANELNFEELKKFKTVGVTAGTSTPDWQFKEVVKRLQAL